MSLFQLTESSGQLNESNGSHASVDIVAVHGLYENGHDTWIAGDPAGDILWLRDLFPHRAHNARVLAYEYPSRKMISSGEGTATQVSSYAACLVAELAADRWHDNGVERPIIFICHGIGGLLVKKALIHASGASETSRAVYTSTYAILFMGTPHQGIHESVLFASPKHSEKTHRVFLAGLLEDSSFLKDITDQFAPHMKRFIMYNFWEQVQTTVGTVKALVVHKDSAAPGGYVVENCGINTTHSGLVKFRREQDPGYKVVLAALARYRQDAPGIIRSRWQRETAERQAEHEQAAKELLSYHRRRQSSQHPMICGTTDRQEYMVPHPPSEIFVGRRMHLDKVRDSLGEPEPGPVWHRPKVLVVCGLGGSGKTRSTLQFAEESRDRYWGIFWVDASDEGTLETRLSTIATMVGKGSTQATAIHWLSTCLKPWLLILDNADDPDMSLSDYFPSGGNGHILITTRYPGASRFATAGCIRLGEMDPEDAIILLLKSAYPEPQTESQDPKKKGIAREIAHHLGYLAIALAQAGAAIRKKIYTIEVYLYHFLGHRKSIMNRHKTVSAPHLDAITTWEMPFQRIMARPSIEHGDAVELVHIFAFMHFESIPEKIFRRSWHDFASLEGAVSYPGLLQVGSPWDEEAQARFRRAVLILCDYSIVDHDPDKETCSLHPVVHRWARDRVEDGSLRLRWISITMSILAHCISPHLEASGFLFRKSILSHINACLRELRWHCPTIPDTMARATEMERFACVYAENGRWKQAKTLQESILGFRMKRLGKRHEDTIRVLRSLGQSNWNLFDFETAGNNQRAVLMSIWWLRPSLWYWVTWRPFRPDHVEYCVTLSDLTVTAWLAGRLEASRYLGERAVQGLTRRLGPDDPRTLSAVFNLARTYLHLGDQQLSHKMFLRVVLRRKRFFGMNHPDTLEARNELGVNLCAQKKRLAVAERVVTNVLKARKRLLGERHAYYLWSINDLSKVQCERKRPYEAVASLENIIDVVRETLGDEHVGMTMTRSNLARAYVLCEHWGKAEIELSGLLEVVPSDHPDYINTLSGMVHVRIRMGKLEQAEIDCTKLVNIIQTKKIIPVNSPRALSVYEQMMEVYQLQGRHSEMEALRKKMPTAKAPQPERRFDMMPTRRILRRESELDRLIG
ncbi:hypothetical protein LTS15_003439 [Exophiala xenobiotica]|nr:hypothetical protein LTS15_003439 [Exophiala xenobiotica]